MNTQHAFFLNAGGRSLSATLFLPQTHASGVVLFVPPFVEERKGALPAFVQTARVLAGRGIASLLFDFSGCGDSEGVFEEYAPAIFDDDCEAAWTWLAHAFPTLPRAVLGLRCGALLAARLAVRHPETTACVQWAPVAGTGFVRQLLQRRMVNDMVAYGKAREGRAALEARLQRGETVDLDGYPVSGAFYAWLLDLVPQACEFPLYVAAGGHDTQTAAACATGSGEASSLALRFPPFWNTVGHVDLAVLIEETAAWLTTIVSKSSTKPASPSVDFTPPPLDSRLPFLGSEDAVSAIFDPPPGTPRAGVLFLHGWSGDRTGPHRLFTRFARQLARQGYLCLRPDFIGRGLSGGTASDAAIVGMAENAQDALNALRGRLAPGTPIIVVAICSGCKVAVTLAAANPEIARLVLWSAESMGGLRSSTTGLRKTLAMLTTYARKLARPETWIKILRGRVQTQMVTKALVKQETRSAQEAVWENGMLHRFRAFRNPVLFVFGGSDPDAAGSRRAYALYCRRNSIPHDMHTVAHAGHSYYGEAWTRELLDVSLGFLDRKRSELV